MFANVRVPVHIRDLYGLSCKVYANEPLKYRKSEEHNIGYGGYIVESAEVQINGMWFRVEQSTLDGSWQIIRRSY